ncbi:MAG: sigma-70 family RNA polymerase sigma factor [Polyangiaceae bacterium]|nr:sigma-70 family RNA polymerase sigma factor [Polyangiaceae bacterium]
MSKRMVHSPQDGAPEPVRGTASADGENRWIAELLARHFARIWRVARRTGLGPAQVEEAAQEAFIVLFERRASVEPGKELAFLLSTVTLISRNIRRKASEARELPCAPDALDQHAAQPMPLSLLERKRARDQVDQILTRLSEPLRVVFVLYELEQLTLREIADVLNIPLGTAGSRLRLARKGFQEELRRLGAEAQEEP